MRSTSKSDVHRDVSRICFSSRRQPTPSGGPRTKRAEEAWIIVCENMHGAVGPIPGERLAARLAAAASGVSGCNYHAVRLG
jgi:hypothetical protein